MPYLSCNHSAWLPKSSKGKPYLYSHVLFLIVSLQTLAIPAMPCRDADAAGVSHLITFRSGTCGEWQLPSPPQLVVTNPPWGGRIMGAGSHQQADRLVHNSILIGDSAYGRKLHVM